MSASGRFVVLAVVVTGAASLSACRSSLSVKVERVVLADADKLPAEGPLGRRLLAAVERLHDAETRLARLDTALAELAQGSSDAGALALAVAPSRSAFSTARRVARGLSDDILSRFAATDVADAALRGRADLLRVESFWIHEYAVAAGFKKLGHTIPDFQDAMAEASKSDARLAHEVNASAQAVAVDQASVPRAGLGFGGFVSTDVYMLNPSDRAYQRVLAAQKVVLSNDPLTTVDVNAAGDSSILVVLEQPAQARLFQVTADPTQVARNLGMIMNKASGAALRFLSGAGAP